MSDKEKKENPKYIRIFLSGFILSALVYFILVYFRNNGFVPFRYLFF